MSLIGKTPDAPRLMRKEFSYRGKRYVAIRFRGGRVELYRVDDGLEQFVHYARKSGGRLDRIAIGLVEDKLDPAAIEARMLLANEKVQGYSDVRMSEPWGHWGGVEYTHHPTGFPKSFRGRASLRLYNEIGEARAGDYGRREKTPKGRA